MQAVPDNLSQHLIPLFLLSNTLFSAAKHTTREIMGKIADATTNKGGGKAGLEDRQGGKGGHAKFQCHIVSDSDVIYADTAPCTTPP